MKKLYSFLTVFCLFGLFFAFTPSQAGAVDVWAYSSSGNEHEQPYEAYVISESIKWDDDYTFADFLVKEVHNGKVLKVRRCGISNFEGRGHWKYVFDGMPIWTHFEPYDNSIGAKLLQVCYNYL